MLSDQDKARIRQEELFKAELRDEIASARERPKANSWVGRMLANDNTRWVATTVAIPLAVAIWGFFASYLADKARKQEQDITTGQRNVELVIQLLPALEKAPGAQGRLNAIAVIQTLEKVGKLTPELRSAFESSQAQLQSLYDPEIGFTDPGARREAEYVASLTQSAPGSSATAEVSAIARVVGAQVYIQIFRDDQRPAAAAVQKAIRGLGLGAPGIENVVATAASRNRPAPKRYNETVLLVFKQSDLPVAQRVADAVKVVLGTPIMVSPRWDVAQFRQVPAGQLELWFADKAAQ